MNFSLSPEQQALQSSTAEFAQTLNAQTDERERRGGFTREEWKACAEAGLTALPVPTAFGGPGCSALDTILALESFGYGCSDGGLGFSLGAHVLAGVVPVLLFANEDQQHRYLPAFGAGDLIIANAMTETASGSDAFALGTSAKRTEGGYVLNGMKTFCTNAPLADLLLVYALSDPQKGFFGGISAFLLEKGRHLYIVAPPMEKMGLHSSPLAEVMLDDVFVEDAQLLGKAGGGGMIFNQSMDWERAGLAALHAGTMRRLIEQSAAYVKERHVGGHPASAFQAVAFKLADMQVRMEASRLLAYKAACMLDEKRSALSAAARAKITASEALIATAQDAMQLHGGNGYMKAFGIERALRDAMASTIYSGTNEVLRNLLAEWGA